MLNFKKYLITGALVVSSWCSVANADCIYPWNSLSLSGGWSHDDLKTKVHSHGSGESDVRLNSKVDGINVWKIGAQLNLAIPSFGCGCDDWWWLNNFYLRGYAYRGWVSNAKFHSSVREGESGYSASARAHKGRTVNGLIGLGFLYPVCDDFSFGPVAGWSYDQLRISTKRKHHSGSDISAGSEASSGSENTFGAGTFSSTWRGPWVGVDFAWNLCACDCWSFRFVGGYEYHWSHWKGSVSSRDHSGSEGSGSRFTSHRHSNNAHGQVAYVSGWWNVCDCWDIGLGLDYKYYDSKKGKGSRHDGSGSGSASGSGHDRVKKNSWRSIGLTLDLAYRF